MPWATPEREAEIRVLAGPTRAGAEDFRSRIQPRARPQFSYGEQLGAAFRQENLALVLHSWAQNQGRVFAPEDGFDPEPFLGPYAAFRSQFPELLRARSRAELAHTKNQIDRELRDREILDGMGFWRGLAVYGPAGLLSPENALPVGAAIRGAGIVGKVATRSILRTAARIGAEGAIAQAAAESVLLPLQGLRTTEEAAINIVGGGVFGSVLGGAAGAIGKGRAKALKELIGRETLTEAANDYRAAQQAVFDPTTPQGQRMAEEWDKFSILADSPETFAFAEEHPVRGRMIEALQERNPKFAKLLGAESRVARSLMRLMTFQPAMRLATSESEASRIIGKVLTGHFVTKDVPEGARGLSVEGALGLMEYAAKKSQVEQRDLYQKLKKGPLKGIPEADVFRMVGEARLRGDQASDLTSYRLDGQEYDPFAPIRENEQAMRAVEELSKKHDEFSNIFKRTAAITGAYTDGPKTRGRVEEIMSLIEQDYLHRRIDQELARTHEPQLRARIEAALEARRDVVLPEYRDQLEAFEAERAGATDPRDISDLDEQIGLINEAINKVDSPQGFADLSWSIQSNYMPRPNDTRVRQQNPYIARVLDIDDRYLGDFLIKDVREIQERMVKRILPDLVLADQWHLRLGGNAAPQRQLAKDLETFDGKVEAARANGADEDAANDLLRQATEVDDRARMNTLLADLRLLRDGEVDVPALQREVHEGYQVRWKTQRERANLRKVIAETEREIRFRKSAGEDVAEFEASVAEKKQAIEDSYDLSDAATVRIEAIAHKVHDQVGAAKGSGALRYSDLVPRRRDITLAGAETPEQIQRRLDTVNLALHSRVAESRRHVYALNVDTEHLTAAVERDWNARAPQRTEKQGKRMRKEQEAIETIVHRMRNTHGVQEGDIAAWGKRVRDFQYMTKMGSILLSSFPDIAMAVSTAGFAPYATALAKNIKAIATGKIPKGTQSEVVYAVTRAGRQLRAEKLYGVEDQFAPRNRADRFMQQARETFTELSLIRRWNAFNRAVAHQAIESRVVQTILKGPNASKLDLALLEFFGISADNMADMRTLLERSASHDDAPFGKFYYANANAWRSENPAMADIPTERLRNLRLELDGAILKGVNDTILEPSAGDLPNVATAHPLGRMLFQFRSFSFATMQRFMVPGAQRVFGLGDVRPAFSAALASVMGMFVYASNELIKGRDPFAEPIGKDGKRESWQKRWIWEGIDRGGTLGILTEAASSVDRAMGAGLLESSRFSSRSEFDALLGPSYGFGTDVVRALGSFSDGEFSQGDAARLRRLTPYQNLLVLRLLLDVGPNAPNAGSRRYYDRFLKAEERLFGFQPWEVNR